MPNHRDHAARLRPALQKAEGGRAGMNSDFPCRWAVPRRFSGKGDPGRVPVNSTAVPPVFGLGDEGTRFGQHLQGSLRVIICSTSLARFAWSIEPLNCAGCLR